MSPRPRQARGVERRRQVLEATLRLLASGGPRAVTHRAVAAEAGTSVRATTYYFDSRDELLAEALRHYAETAIARFDALALPAEALATVDPELLVEAAARMLAWTVVSDLRDDRAGLVAEYELVLEIGRNAALEEVYQRWQERLEEMLRAYATALGSADPALDARLVLATLRGLEIEALARPSVPIDVADLEAMFQRLIRLIPRS